MKHKIKLMSQYALSILKNSDTGIVHSVYRKTINIKINDCLLALQADNSPLSPISLITELDETSMNALDVIQGLPVRINETSLEISSYIFDFSDAKVLSLKPETILNISALETLKEQLKCAIQSVQTGGFDTIFHSYWNPDIELPSLIIEGARNYMSQSHKFYESGEYNQSASALVRLIGLGTGLTPSGDDFLCGVFAGLALTGKTDSVFSIVLRNQTEDHLFDTNDISQAFLKCALLGQFSLPVNALFTGASTSEIIDSFQRIGHSSGIDTLCGIYYSLNLRI